MTVRDISRRDFVQLGSGAAATAILAGASTLLIPRFAFGATISGVGVTQQNDGIAYSDDQQSGYFAVSHQGQTHTGYCATSWEPRQVRYAASGLTAHVADSSLKVNSYSIDADLLRRAMWYGAGLNSTPNGPGYDTSIFSDAIASMPDVAGKSVREKIYICVHILVTYAMWAECLKGYNNVGDTWVQNAVCTNVVSATFKKWAREHLFTTVVKNLRDAPAPPSGYKAYALYPTGASTSIALEGSGNQIVTWGELAQGALTVEKATAF